MRIADIVIALLVAGIFGGLIYFPVLALVGVLSDLVGQRSAEPVMPIFEVLVAAFVTLGLCFVCFRMMHKRLR